MKKFIVVVDKDIEIHVSADTLWADGELMILSNKNGSGGLTDVAIFSTSKIIGIYCEGEDGRDIEESANNYRSTDGDLFYV